MGQYHYICNLDKHEFLHPHRFGDGLKMLEFGCSSNGTLTGLTVLLACSHDRGGGDLYLEKATPEQIAYAGRWAGDRITIIGDYSDDGDQGFDVNDNPWHSYGWTDISAEVISLLRLDGYIASSLQGAL
jgi:hypothetical protein